MHEAERRTDAAIVVSMLPFDERADPLASALLGIFLIPSLDVVFQHAREWVKRRRGAEGEAAGR